MGTFTPSQTLMFSDPSGWYRIVKCDPAWSRHGEAYKGFASLDLGEVVVEEDEL